MYNLSLYPSNIQMSSIKVLILNTIWNIKKEIIVIDSLLLVQLQIS